GVENRVPLRVDFVRVHEGLDDLIVCNAERPRRRRRADGQQGVSNLLPVPGVKVHHHDRADAALLPVEAGLLRDSVEGVGEFVLAPRRRPRGPGNRHGDPAITPVSMMTAIGVWAARLTFSPSFWIEARDDTTPSWLAAVGTLTNGTPALKDAHFATSIERPPPTPSANSMFPLRIFSSPSRTSFIVASGIKNSEVRIFRAASSISTVIPAIFIVVSSATIKARFPNFSGWQTSPTVCRASWPTTTFRGSS